MDSSEKQKLLPRLRMPSLYNLIASIGIFKAFKYLIYWRFGFKKFFNYTIHPRQSIYPLTVRLNTSDIDVFNQIFIDCEYSCLNDLKDVRLIVDCGANVGYSSAYFLSQFPNCKVIAIEPDNNNYSMLQHNLLNYRNRIKMLHAGVWPYTANLTLSNFRYRDGREWTKQVQECGFDEKFHIQGISIESVLNLSGHDRISILKVDIEGAEAKIFGEKCQTWIDKVDAIAIELHDDSIFGKATDIFFSAIQGQGFQVSQRGELTICIRPQVFQS